mmetsp:Transcript_48786/g.122178  ORF Transcript_48786/g.122178 Transcript_48786/m.122178 type:complete len:104 (-) Transcript_48786:1620-1931(-)
MRCVRSSVSHCGYTYMTYIIHPLVQAMLSFCLLVVSCVSVAPVLGIAGLSTITTGKENTHTHAHTDASNRAVLSQWIVANFRYTERPIHSHRHHEGRQAAAGG